MREWIETFAYLIMCTVILYLPVNMFAWWVQDTFILN